jgi:hemin uptake protein HemP
MSKISLAPDVSGTGIFTIASPNSNTNRTLTLPDDTGTIVTNSGNQAGSFTTLNTSGAVVFNDAGADVDFRVEGDTNANLLFVDAGNDRVGIGVATPQNKFQIDDGGVSATGVLRLNNPANAGDNFGVQLLFSNVGSGPTYHSMASITAIRTNTAANYNSDLLFATQASSGASLTERARITSSGDLLIGKTAISITANGAYFQPGRNAGNGCQLGITNTENSNSGAVLTLNRQGSDGDLIYFYQANIEEGGVSVSGSTVSYNGGHLSRWAQMLTKPDLLKGTVMSNLDEMNVYVKPTLYWTENDELPVDEEGNPTVAVGDLKQETSVSENEQLNKVKVSDVEGDFNVAGVFVNWTYDEAHQVDEINMAMTGDMIIRIAEGVTVARGDLLMSAGDGTAKPQGDDIVRSKTVAKVTSTHVTCTYEDGSYCVPCVLMAC